MTVEVLEALDFGEIQKLLASHAVSTLSKEAAMSIQPTSVPEIVARQLEETGEAVVCLQREITSPLGETHDVREALDKARKDILLLPQEFLDICASLETYKKMRQFFMGERTGVYPVLYEITQNILPVDTLVTQVRGTFNDHGDIQDNASVKLSNIRHAKNTLKDRIRRALQQILQDKGNASYFQEQLITQRNGRYVIPIRAEYRYKFEGIIHDRSASGQTLFMEPMISVQLNNDLAELNLQEKQEIHEILQRLTRQVKKDADHIAVNCKTATALELIFARGELAIHTNGVAAIHDRQGYAELRSARHPLIDPQKAVPIHIRLGKEFHTLVITGSNAGGKTIAMKTLGLLALMNQSGLFIPAAEGSRLPVYRHIYTVIGDEQSIQYNLSTFSSYITQMAAFLAQCQEGDLVLLDELGSGTDPIEGAALAQAVAEYLNRNHISSVITSHFSEMKKMAYESDGMENAFVEFDEKTLTPTYRLIIGMAGNSNAFNICRRLGMGECILSRAEELKAESPLNNMELIMARLNRELQETEKEREALEAEVKEAQQLRNELAEANEQLQRRKTDILDRARAEAEQMKRQLRIQSETIIKDLKRAAAQLDRRGLEAQIGQARAAVQDISIPSGGTERRKLKQEEVQPGVTVYVDTIESVGVVDSVFGKKAKVRCGNLTFHVGVEHCFEVHRGEVKPALPHETARIGPASRSRPVQTVRTSLNVIGLTVDEAIPQVDRFLNDAVMAGVSPVEIIHGKGTGALRKGIQNYLRTLNFVADFHNADARTGGDGVTEVYFD